MINRRKTKQVRVGNIRIGGGAPISVQSMTTTKTEDAEATVAQILELEKAGCEIARVTVPTEEAAEALPEIKARTHIPLVADIHFDYRLALKAIASGVDKIRINPGNIGARERVEAVLGAAKEKGIPIRIGVNAGSLERDLLEKYDGITADGMVESALRHVTICQEHGFDDIVLSLKASDVPLMIDAYRKIASEVDYPLHLGVTEAGTPHQGIVKSAVGIGTLLEEGIGDTIRVSLTADPVEEVRVGFEILKSLKLRQHGLNIVACPTCGRLEVDLIGIVNRVEKRLAGYDKNLTISILGCAVNGPGEAAEADIGVACGKHAALVYKKGRKVKKIREEEIVDYLVQEVENWPDE
jgi:(E)-4-hydroxy-3-methylbut-2-enyl-diphosphate synthase